MGRGHGSLLPLGSMMPPSLQKVWESERSRHEKGTQP